MTWSPSLVSSAEVGSSNRTSSGSFIRARPMATRCAARPRAGRAGCRPGRRGRAPRAAGRPARVPCAPVRGPELVDHEQVLAGGEERHQVHGLEHEADRLAAELGELLRRVAGDVLAADHDRALGRRQEPAGDRAQRGLARPGRADQGDDLVAADASRSARSRATTSSSPTWYVLRTPSQSRAGRAVAVIGSAVGSAGRSLGSLRWRRRGRPAGTRRSEKAQPITAATSR